MIIKARSQKELEMRIKDSIDRGMKLLQQGVERAPIHTFYWARIESTWEDR